MEAARKQFKDASRAVYKAQEDFNAACEALEALFAAEYAAKQMKLAKDVGFTSGAHDHKYKQHDEGSCLFSWSLIKAYPSLCV